MCQFYNIFSKEVPLMLTWVSVGAGLLVTAYAVMFHQLLLLLDE